MRGTIVRGVFSQAQTGAVEKDATEVRKAFDVLKQKDNIFKTIKNCLQSRTMFLLSAPLLLTAAPLPYYLQSSEESVRKTWFMVVEVDLLYQVLAQIFVLSKTK